MPTFLTRVSGSRVTMPENVWMYRPPSRWCHLGTGNSAWSTSAPRRMTSFTGPVPTMRGGTVSRFFFITCWTRSELEASAGKPSASASRPRLPSPPVNSLVHRPFPYPLTFSNRRAGPFFSSTRRATAPISRSQSTAAAILRRLPPFSSIASHSRRSTKPMVSSSPRILRRALLEERRDALGIVVRRPQPRVGLPLQLERRLQRRLGSAVEHHLQRAKGERRPLGQLPGKRIHRPVEIIVGNRLRDEAPGFSALGGDALARHHEELGARHAHQPERPLGAAASRDHAEPHLGEGELRPERRDADIAGHGQLETGPHGEAIDGRDDGLPAALRRGQRVAPQLQLGRRKGQELRDVAAGAEGLAPRAANHDHPDALVGLEPAEDAGELVAHGNRHGVHLRLPVDPHGGGGARALDSQELAHIYLA